MLASMALLLPITLLGATVEQYSDEDKLPIVEFMYKGFFDYVGVYPGHRASGKERVKYMLETFGKPIKIEKMKKEDWREPGLIRDHTIRYFDGVIIETSTETAFRNKQHYIESIEVITLENPKYTLYEGIKIGMSFSNFTKILKVKKRKILNDRVTYMIGRNPGRHKITVFVSQKGIITKIVWDYLEG